uniref:VWFA domain-containing protein n=1 Tax=Echeneis naucrates TaxID=173247 RepID=A0A665U2P3_ECHNA
MPSVKPTCSASLCTQEAVADIVFLVDGSWSIGAENFEQIRQFLYTLVDSFDVRPDHVRISLVQYSNSPRTEFLLNTFQDKADILQYISKLPYMGGGTHTGQGLDFMLKEHFVPVAGSRAAQKVPQIAVVITDGKSQDNVESHAQDLKRRGIVLYAIGIKDADEDQLREIANEPYIAVNFIGPSNFEAGKEFLRNVVSGFDIGPDKVRVGLAQYSDQTYQEFLLKDHMDKQALLSEISEFPYRTGGTETGKAIDFLLDTYFTKEAGSRASQRVPQIAVIITDGDSTDDVVAPAQRLRQHGVIVFAIGVGDANQNELQAIASRPTQRFLFTINSYQALAALRGGLLQTVCISMEDQRQGNEHPQNYCTHFLSVIANLVGDASALFGSTNVTVCCCEESMI